MPRFGKASKAALDTCDERLQRVANSAIKLVDFGIIQGHRSKEQQRLNVESGVSKTMKSKHLLIPSAAFDFAPWIPGIGALFGNQRGDIPKVREMFGLGTAEASALIREHYTYTAGIIMGVGHAMGIDLRWGGDWNRDGNLFNNGFDDLGHIELVEP